MKQVCLIFLSVFSFSIYAQDTLSFSAYFESDKHVLSTEQVKSLDSLLQKLEGNLDDFVFEIQGHTDSIGNWNYNLQLSDKRCQSLEAEVAKLGVSRSHIKIKANSYSAPVDLNSTETGRAHNRRAQLTIIYTPEKPDWKLTEQSYKINPNIENNLITRNGCVIKIPANATIGTENLDEIEYRITEYNNPAEFIAGGIPMSYEHQSGFYMYHSEELFTIYAINGKDTLKLHARNNISIHCKNVDTSEAVKFYEFNAKYKNWVESKTEIGKVGTPVVNGQMAFGNDSVPDKKKALPVKSDKTLKTRSGGSDTSKVLQEVQPLRVDTTLKPTPADTAKASHEIEPLKTDSVGSAPKKEKKEEAKEPEKKVESPPSEPPKEGTKKGEGNKRKKDKTLPLDTVRSFRRPPVIPNKIDTAHIPKTGRGGGGLLCEVGKDWTCFEFWEMVIKEALIVTEKNFNPYTDTTAEFVHRNYTDFYRSFNYAGIRYVDTTNKAEKNNSLLYPLKFKSQKRLFQKKYKLKFKHLKRENAFFKNFADYKWIYDAGQNRHAIKALAKKKYSDCRINYNEETNTVGLELKSRNGFYQVSLTPKIRKSKRKILSQKIKRFNDSLAGAEKLFYEEQTRDSLLFRNGLRELFNLNYFRLYYFWYYSECAKEEAERGLPYRQWVGYFNKNREHIRQRYEAFQKNPSELFNKCCRYEPPKRRLSGGGDGDPEYLILNFGRYNFDKLIPLKRTVPLKEYTFLSERGNRIEVDYAFLILKGFNGMVDFGGAQNIFLVNGFGNKLIVFTKSGRCYKYKANLIEKDFSEKKVLVLKNITRTILSKKGFEEEMSSE